MIDATLHQIGRMLAHRTSTVTTGARRMKSGRCTTTKYQDEPGNRKTAGGTRSRPEITYPPATDRVKCEVAVGKMKVGPVPRTQLPECAGDSNSSKARSPKPAARSNWPGTVWCGTML